MIWDFEVHPRQDKLLSCLRLCFLLSSIINIIVMGLLIVVAVNGHAHFEMCTTTTSCNACDKAKK